MFHPLRILLLDDEPLIHTTIRILLGKSPDFELVEATANIAELPASCTRTKPHILLLGGGSSSLTHEVSLIVEQACPQTQIILLLNASDPRPLPAVRVAGCCFKHEINEGLPHLLRAIAAGMTWVSGGVAARSDAVKSSQDTLLLGFVDTVENKVLDIFQFDVAAPANGEVGAAATNGEGATIAVQNYTGREYNFIVQNSKPVLVSDDGVNAAVDWCGWWASILCTALTTFACFIQCGAVCWGTAGFACAWCPWLCGVGFTIICGHAHCTKPAHP
ncbi:MAG: hypothetical protein NT075_36530 [Chloroflexi bacterium]|nr:hypothetical protein [Chloroflexota bacterium]